MVCVISLAESPADPTVAEQLKGLDYWIEELNNSSEINEKLSFVLLGNKADLAGAEDTTSDELIRNWCKK